MPELPEVEVIKRGLTPHVVGRTVTEISSSHKKLRLPIPVKKLDQFIRNQRIQAIQRRAKYLLFEMTNGAMMIIHLGMSGKLTLSPARAPQAIHDHLRFRLDNEMEMRFNDTRRFGFIQVMDREEFAEKKPFDHLGPEPLEEDFTASYLKKMARKRIQPIKNFLMDSRMVVGIGNIYANEILFYSNILPTTPIGSLTLPMWEKIVHFSREVLSRAIKSGGSTIADFVGSSGKPGYFQLELMVYGRANEPCKLCVTPIAKTVIGGRATYFCPRCQK
ncbi:MAG: bifunctional DNA-formamidopyrimidine glycosylase/DNA-(apurinic or apyrimidinic site) lyase [Thermodesulfobacteriota bacterium]|nr:bifunctional DNA-formamidopyrimidine glycosylase/DNA-(apurinic or apyrimidinic site) lyase [Thermodesulfobacteriota bacterium]